MGCWFALVWGLGAGAARPPLQPSGCLLWWDTGVSRQGLVGHCAWDAAPFSAMTSGLPSEAASCSAVFSFLAHLNFGQDPGAVGGHSMPHLPSSAWDSG